MRTNYPLDKIVRRQNEARRRLAISLVMIGVVVILVVGSGSIRKFLVSALTFVTRPLWVLEDNTLVLRGDMMAFLRSHKGLVEENRSLATEINKLKLELAATNALKAEYDKLAEVAGRSSGRSNKTPIVGQVIVKPNRSPYDLVIVDVGAKTPRPVEVGFWAGLAPEVVVGRVVAVAGRSSTVQLLSSPGLTMPVLIGPDRLQATSTGQGGGSMMIELPRGAGITVGDDVFLPTISRFIVGKVVKINNEDNQPTQKIFVGAPVNPYYLTWLELYESR